MKALRWLRNGLLSTIIFWMQTVAFEQYEWTNTNNDYLDRVGEWIFLSSNLSKQLVFTYDHIVENALRNDADLDLQSWIALGQFHGSLNKPEYAFHCYEIAHLMDYRKVKTNSDLQFETNKTTEIGAPKSQPSIQDE